MNHPHGPCECVVGCQCERSPGPAAMVILRDGKPMRVCTRCSLVGDKVQSLLVTREENASPYLNYDTFGALSLMTLLDEIETENP